MKAKTFKEYWLSTWGKSASMDSFDTTIEKHVWDFQQKRIDRLEAQLMELREILKEAGADSHRCKKLFDWYCEKYKEGK